MNTDWTNFLEEEFPIKEEEIMDYPIVDSSILRSQIDGCSIYHSTITDSHLYFDSEYRLEPDVSPDELEYPIYFSSIQESEVTNSAIQNSTVTNSFIEESTIKDSIIINSVVQNSIIKDSVINNKRLSGKKEEPTKKRKAESEVKSKRGRKKGKKEEKQKKSKAEQMNSSLSFIQPDTAPVELSKLVNLGEIIPPKEDTFPVQSEKGSSTIGNILRNMRCLHLVDGTYAFHSSDLFASVLFYTSNIARYTNKLVVNKQYFVYKKTNVRYITIEGALSLVNYFKNSTSYGKDKSHYLSVMETCLYKISNIIGKEAFSTRVEFIKEKKTKQRNWDNYFNELSAYISQNKQTHVFFPSGTVEYAHLLHWCRNQKYHRKRGILPEDKLERLDSLKGFHWGTYSDPTSPHSKTKWNEMFERLKVYLKSINNQPLYFERCDTKNKKLVKWCQSQKTSVKRKRITEKRYEMLCNLPGFHFGTYTLKDNQTVEVKHINYPV